MSLAQIKSLLKQCKQTGTVESIYFEGGEPFLFYPVMLEGVRLAREMGFTVGIVSNGYWATSVGDAKLWMQPLASLGVSDLSISDDELHYGDAQNRRSSCVLEAAKEVGTPASVLRKSRPKATASSDASQGTGKPRISGGIKFRGRAAQMLAGGLPTRSCDDLAACPYENLADPQRVHVDAFGNVQICQGISMGNCWEKPLAALIADYDANAHPVAGPLVRGGPARLAGEYNIDTSSGYVDECHLCYAARLALLDRFPQHLAPKQAYGL